jgi:hypothetical protein
MSTVMRLDVSLGSENGGDTVISDAILAELEHLGARDWMGLPTHHRPRTADLRRAAGASTILIGGSNILASHLERHRQWLLTPDLVLAYRHKLVACGVGWWQYQGPPCRYSATVLKAVLDPTATHSVRDSYTHARLTALGFDVINTGCPTMWSLPAHFRATDSGPDAPIVATITDYNRDLARDRQLLTALTELSTEVCAVAMAPEDHGYLAELAVPNVRVPAGLGVPALQEELRPGVRYVGTRLHGGIRAMQRGVPAVIIGIDNRAREIAADTGLCVLDPADLSIDRIAAALARASDLPLRINRDGITQWKTALAVHIAEQPSVAVA